jgi:hypothetical protein
MLQEKLLHYVWKNGLFSGKTFRIREGMELEILLPGEENPHAGPDFFNARLRIGSLIWAGNVEIHRSASDWNKHGHQLDPAYDNVILHVIQYDDAIIRNSQGRLIHAFVVEPTDSLLECVRDLRKNERWIPCCNHVGMVPERVLKPWLIKLSAERMLNKAAHLSGLADRQGRDSENMLCLAMASGFGLPINSLPFELLTSGIPRALLFDLRDNLHDLEALLYGHSGLLHKLKNQDPYTSALMKRYDQLKKAVPGPPLPSHIWKFLRIRPASFPTLRISQFAALIHFHFPLNNIVSGSGSLAEMEQCLQLSASEYWNTHYVFQKPSPFSIKKLGRHSINNLIINVILPYILSTENWAFDPAGSPSVEKKLAGLEPENNQLIDRWIRSGIHPKNALETQALIQLYQAYCRKKRCSACPIGDYLGQGAD